MKLIIITEKIMNNDNQTNVGTQYNSHYKNMTKSHLREEYHMLIDFVNN